LAISAKVKDSESKNRVWQGRAGRKAPNDKSWTYKAELSEALKNAGYSSVAELERAISEKKTFLNQAKQKNQAK
jgi:hypothetical protein